jgi:hypothetical protein
VDLLPPADLRQACRDTGTTLKAVVLGKRHVASSHSLPSLAEASMWRSSVGGEERTALRRLRSRSAAEHGDLASITTGMRQSLKRLDDRACQRQGEEKVDLNLAECPRLASIEGVHGHALVSRSYLRSHHSVISTLSQVYWLRVTAGSRRVSTHHDRVTTASRAS